MTLLYKDNFKNTDNWLPEIEVGGATVWFRHELIGPVVIEYEAAVLSKGGTNDRVSDLNCFWMSQDDPNKVKRNGAFPSYDTLKCYYVGLGGNSNTTTRFRRYIGQAGNRPLLPEHDLSAPEVLLKPNTKQKVRLTASGKRIEYARDGKTLFTFDDPEPYVRGWFAFRTVTSHIEYTCFRVSRP